MKKQSIIFLLILLIVFYSNSLFAEEKNIMSEIILESDNRTISYSMEDYINGKLEKLMFNIYQAEKNNNEKLYKYLDEIVYNNYYFDSMSGNVPFLLFNETVKILKNNEKYRKLFINNKKENIVQYIKELQNLKMKNIQYLLGKAYVIEIYLRLVNQNISTEIEDELINFYRYFRNNKAEKNMLFYLRPYTLIYYYGSWLNGSFKDDTYTLNTVSNYSLENPLSYLLSLEQIIDFNLKNIIAEFTFDTLLNYSDIMGYKNKKTIYQLLKLVENKYPELFIYKVENQERDIKLSSNALEVILPINYSSSRDKALILSFCLYYSYKVANFFNKYPQNISIYIEKFLNNPKAHLKSNKVYTILSINNKWNSGAITHELLHIYTNNFIGKVSDNIFLVHGIICFIDYYLNKSLDSYIEILKTDFINNYVDLEDMFGMSIQEQMNYGLNKLDQQFVFFLYFLNENHGIVKIRKYIDSDLTVRSLERIFDTDISDLNSNLKEFYNIGQPAYN